MNLFRKKEVEYLMWSMKAERQENASRLFRVGLQGQPNEKGVPKNRRPEDVEHYLSMDNVRPLTVQANPDHPIMLALRNVLLHLPEDIFEEVDSYIRFVVDADKFSALNVPFELPLPPSTEWRSSKTHVIVIFERALEYSQQAIVAIVAHEIAHSFVVARDHLQNEEAADQLVREWGFAEEQRVLNQEKAAFAAKDAPTQPD
jgi:hypothetical protein